jgi:hypothetical protein
VEVDIPNVFMCDSVTEKVKVTYRGLVKQHVMTMCVTGNSEASFLQFKWTQKVYSEVWCFLPVVY